jgi:integrase
MSENNKIKKNMLRERAERFPEVTDEMWEQICDDNKEIVEEYFEMNPQLSKQTQKQYKSAFRIFFWWIKIRCKNKPLYQIRKVEFIKYRSYLINHGLSSNALGLKKSAVSSLCNFIENIYCEENQDYENFKNFTRGLPPIPKNTVYEKIKVSKEEYLEIMKVLEEQEDYLGMAWTATAFNVGGRRGEIRQFKTEILDYSHHKNSKGEEQAYRLSHLCRGKGKSIDGKPLRFMINDEAIKYMKLWVEKRGYDNEYIFTTTYAGIHQISIDWADNFCTNKLSIILGRRINPHLFKASCITYLLEEGKSLKTVSKYVAHHESVETTQIYDLRSDEDERDGLF